MALPKPQTGANPNLGLTLSQWATQLSPLMDSPLAQPVILKQVALSAGTNTIPHRLGRPLQGWIVVRQRGPSTVTTPITGWASYTPTLTTSGGGAITLNGTGKVDPNGWWRQVGDSVEIQASLQNGSGGAATGTAGNVQLSLPAGLTADTSKMATDTGGFRADGISIAGAAAAADNTGTVRLVSNLMQVERGTATVVVVADLAASYRIQLSARFPIVGWSSAFSLGLAQLYDTQDSNPYPDRTLLLVSSATATVDLLVF